jgi:osmotically-inducible protein OsmY
MRAVLAGAVLSVVLGFSLGCSNADQERSRERAAEAQRKARDLSAHAGAEARKLGSEAKTQAKELGGNIDRALESSRGDAGSGSSEAEAKLRRGGERLREAGGQAAGKLDKAALLARVKTKLASEAGLSMLATDVEVDASHQVVTLRGTVDSEAQRQQAEDAVRQVSGVAKVVNELAVKAP